MAMYLQKSLGGEVKICQGQAKAMLNILAKYLMSTQGHLH